MKTVFIVLDTLRRDYLGPYGNDWVKTPSIDRLAERGVTFENHYVGSLPCMPARREFMTGRTNFLYRSWGPIEPFDDTLPVWLRNAGVFSHLLTDHYHYFELGGENYHTGFDTWEFFRGQEWDPWVSLVDRQALPPHIGTRYNHQNHLNRQKQQKEEDYSGPKTARSAIDWLKANEGSDDWFLHVEIFDPHEPYVTTDKYREMYNDTWEGPLWDWPSYDVVKESPEAVDHIRKAYAGLLTMTDHWVGKIFDEMERQGIFEDTLVVLTTDHGTMLAEHDYWMKNYLPVYNEIARIPLVIHLPGGKQAGSRVPSLTQTIDIMPTILEQHGAKLPPHLHGKSLLPAIEGTPVREDGIFGYFGKATNITDGRYVYFRNPVNDDAGPLHEYTAMPTKFGKFHDRSTYADVETGRYFTHTYNLPLYRFPATGQVPKEQPGDDRYVARHQLFDLENDPAQESPIEDREVEARLLDRMRSHLGDLEAPAEQFTRIGIEPA